LVRRFGIDEALRKADRIKNHETIAAYKHQSEAEARDESKGEGLALTHQKRVVVNHHLEAGLVDQILTLRGEPVLIAYPTQGGEPRTVASTDSGIVDGDARSLGIALGNAHFHPTADADGNYGRVNIVTSGQCPALVMGPCNVGDSLCLAATTSDKTHWPTPGSLTGKTGKYLKRGPGAFTAMESVPAGSTPVMAWVKIQDRGTGDGPTITIDGGGSVLSSTNPTMGGATVEVQRDCSIVQWTVEGDAAGAIVVDVTRANKAVPSTSIVGSGNKPTLTASNQYASAAPSGWTSVDLKQGDIIGFAVISATTVTRVTVTLRVA
jgi:hypothetical protein